MTEDLSAFMKLRESGPMSEKPIILIAFSSMPVGYKAIMKIVVKMATESKTKPRVIGVTGVRDTEPLGKELDAKKAELEKSGQIYICARAPFGILFDMMDAVIIHGGLGTTAEALRAKLPTIVTGVLLMDQRFWGQRCNDLGVGPPPCHVTDFPSKCCEYIDQALAADSKWKENGAVIAEKIKAKDPGDGVR